jgi:hypothetical protein
MRTRAERVENMKAKRFFTVGLATIVTCVCLGFFGALHARAQEVGEPLEDNKDAVIKSFCGEDGKLATCIKLPASDCSMAIRPLVDACYEKRDQFAGGSGMAAKAFHSCFWFEFNKRYSKDMQHTEECYAIAKEAFPLQPVPPHLEGQMQLLNPPGGKKGNGGELGY